MSLKESPVTPRSEGTRVEHNIIGSENIQEGPDVTIGPVDLQRGARGRIAGGDIGRWAIGIIVVFLWLFSFVGPLDGWMIHLILAVATVVFLMNLIMLDPESSWA